jgi:hypothetical protein
MLTHRKQFQVIFISVTFTLLIGVSSALCDNPITYRLLPGSTIKPVSGNIVTGPTENLTGTFIWHEIADFGPGNAKVFDATYLHFESDSYTFNLHTTGPYDYASGVWNGSNIISFDEFVNITGLSLTMGRFATTIFGTYSGPTACPTSFSVSNIELWPFDTLGPAYAKITLYAEQVPEPATLLLLGLGALRNLKRFPRL